MSKEFLIIGMRQQREMLDRLLGQLEQRRLLDEGDYHFFESTAREVEKELKKLRRFAVDELVREIHLRQVFLDN